MEDYRQVTSGWHVIAIDETRESAQKAAELLEGEADREAKYWADVLSVSESGWSVCRLPRERHTLGVRFGFNEGRAHDCVWPRGHLLMLCSFTRVQKT